MKYKNFSTNVKHFNEWFAVLLTKKVVGTMWCSYGFMLYGLLGLVLPDYMEKLTFWSNWPQLWLLPVLLVSSNLLDRAADRREQRMYAMMQQQFDIMKDMIKTIDPNYILPETKRRKKKEVPNG